MAERKRTKTMICKTLHIKLKIGKHKPHKKVEVNSGVLKKW